MVKPLLFNGGDDMKKFEIRIPKTLKINLMEEVINFLSFNAAEEYIENSKHINKYKTM